MLGLGWVDCVWPTGCAPRGNTEPSLGIKSIPETLYHRDGALQYIAYVMLIWAAPIPADRSVAIANLGLTGTPSSSRDKLCPDSALQV